MSRTTMAVQKTELAGSREGRPIEGLCHTCSKGEVCTYPRDLSRPVWSCDEFDGSYLAPVYPPARNIVAARRRTLSEEPGEAAEVNGLCRECANRSTCSYPKPPGGVWQCDELT